MKTDRLYRTAFRLALFTIFYNIAEGVVSTWFGFEDETLSLFGFGIDSFIEVVSGIGIAHMVLRIRANPESERDKYERRALTITGWAFYVLATVLVLTGAYNLWTGHKPTTTFWGIIVSAVSIATMWLLAYGKTGTGNALGSVAILADAACTKVCIYMSLTLLAASLIYSFTGIGYADTVGALGLAWFSFREGRECFEKSRNDSYCCSKECDSEK